MRFSISRNLRVSFYDDHIIPNRFVAIRQQMGVNISQIFRGSIILEKSPSSDIPCVCLMFGDESNGGSIFLRSLPSFGICHLFSFKYWVVLTLSFLFYLSGVTYSAILIAQDTGNGSIEFSFGQRCG